MFASRAARDVALVGTAGAAVLFFLGEGTASLVVAIAAVAWIVIDHVGRRKGQGR
jgi:hypothetical protein